MNTPPELHDGYDEKVTPCFPKPDAGDYFFTVTLGHVKKKDQYIWSRQVRKIIQNYAKRFAMVCEYTKRIDLHFHGYFTILKTLSDNDMDMLRASLSEIGRSDVQLIKDTDNIYNYLSKDLDKTNKIMNYKIRNGRYRKERYRKLQWYKERAPELKIDYDNDVKRERAIVYINKMLDVIRQEAFNPDMDLFF